MVVVPVNSENVSTNAILDIKDPILWGFEQVCMFPAILIGHGQKVSKHSSANKLSLYSTHSIHLAMSLSSVLAVSKPSSS